jgi:hypothetical protein
MIFDFFCFFRCWLALELTGPADKGRDRGVVVKPGQTLIISSHNKVLTYPDDGGQVPNPSLDVGGFLWCKLPARF